MLARWAAFCLWGGENARAGELLAQALTIARHTGDASELGFILLNLGNFSVLAGAFDKAGEAFTEALVHYRTSGALAGVADALSALGALHNTTGDLASARANLEESVALSRKIGDERGLRSSLTNLGNVFYLCGDSMRARENYLEVLPLCQRAGDRSAEAILLCNLGTLAYEGGNLDEAEAMFQQGIVIFDELRTTQHLIHATASLAEVHITQKRYDQAHTELRWTLQTVIDEQIHQMAPLAVYQIALLYQAVGVDDEALKLLLWVESQPASLPEYQQEIERRLRILQDKVGAEGYDHARAAAAQVTVNAVLAGLQRALPPVRP